jgi:hypothetical protein
MNINFRGLRTVVVKNTGVEDIQTTRARVWQTPTKVSYQIASDVDPAGAYRMWVRSACDDGDIVHDHLEDFDAWLRECERGGYEVTAYVT